ncbi:MAG: RNase adapter RapZ [Defluviitaleaceae bacterium]|nr:RNase adapter RapZ [Defluviitaleaceae bacterium]
MSKKINLLIVTGMSGAGKSVVLDSLEDLGYHCIDNLPPKLLPTLTELILTTSDQTVKLAVVIDLRSLSFDSISEMHLFIQDSSYINVQILFLDADNSTLVKRFKETRRSHPLSRDANPLVGISKERLLLAPIFSLATAKINTSGMSARELKSEIVRLYSDEIADYFNVTFASFGFKHGTPVDTDVMFDVRFLPNPFYDEVMRKQTGLDQNVYDFVIHSEMAQTFLTKLVDLLDFLIPNYQAEGKSQVVIGIGCTGGQHRSVALAEYLTNHFKSSYPTHVVHRNIKQANFHGGQRHV